MRRRLMSGCSLLRRPRGAGSVDQERRLIDCDITAFGGGQRACVCGSQRRIQVDASAAKPPGLQHPSQVRTCGLERIDTAGSKNDVIGLCGVDAVGERLPDQAGLMSASQQAR
jgi:hypothetical protein